MSHVSWDIGYSDTDDEDYEIIVSKQKCSIVDSFLNLIERCLLIGLKPYYV
jgi:hypothetical protein